MSHRLGLSALTVVTAMLAVAPFSAAAHHPGGFRGHDIGHFGGHDMRVWRGGHWFHGWHGERFGWWWRFGGPWYLYPTPIYPYPDPYIPPVVVGPPPVATWYHCDNPEGYYPYVATCNGDWRPVPAVPVRP